MRKKVLDCIKISFDDDGVAWIRIKNRISMFDYFNWTGIKKFDLEQLAKLNFTGLQKLNDWFELLP
jgi:hypothetical protein